MSRPRILASMLAVMVLVAACGSTGPTGAPPSSPTPGVATASPDDPTEPPASDDPATPDPVTEPPSSEEPTASEKPTASAETPPPSEDPSPSSEPGAADACTGSDQNREFYLAVAAAVAWDVYCAVLPQGWFVNTGQYRLANGGRLIISYKGPGGATLELAEGAFCPDSSGCVPSGTDAGIAVFGDRDATLLVLDDGGYAIVVDRGQPMSWLLVVGGMDEPTARALGEALARVDG